MNVEVTTHLKLKVPADLPQTLPVLPLRQGFLLPGLMSPFTVGRTKSLAALSAAPEGWLIVGLQRDPQAEIDPGSLLPIGVLAKVVQRLGDRGSMKAVAIQGVARVRLNHIKESEGFLQAQYEVVSSEWPDTQAAEGSKRALTSAVTQVVDELHLDVPVQALIEQIEDPALLSDLVAAMVESEAQWKREVLLELDPLVRVEMVLKQLSHMKEVMSAQRSIEERVRSEAQTMEREVILRRQLGAIQKELGDGDGADDLTALKERLAAHDLPEEARNAVDRELRRIERISAQSPERNVAIDWLTWVADMPWGSADAPEIDLNTLEDSLEKSHFGLKDVKRQVLEHLAVRKLAGSGRADVLLLVGPPGVGKTSIATAIAEATGRKLLRVALGGVRDESELRGHRRTYIGARPGRLVEGLRRAASSEAVVLLDEVDKMGRGHQGDPASALLEILDPEQNHAFVDRYLEVPFDLSRLLFVATANDLASVPGPLRDRMEVLSIEGYTPAEKLKIARNHVLEKLERNAGLESGDVEVSDDALEGAIEGWTREAGVRQLQRVLGKLYRAAAVDKAKGELKGPLVVGADELEKHLGRRKFEKEEHEGAQPIGVATGLAWTPMGGSVLYVEAARVPGKGRLVLTGQLGDVMKESAQAALTYLRMKAAELGIDPEVFERSDLHVHVPAGATPKDGPSAGVTMFSALSSLIIERPVRADVAMTGEISLRGRVLPVGGIKSKVLAAYERGIRRVVVPKRNESDLEDVPTEVLEDLEVILVENLSEVLEHVLVAPEPSRLRVPSMQAPATA